MFAGVEFPRPDWCASHNTFLLFCVPIALHFSYLIAHCFSVSSSFLFFYCYVFHSPIAWCKVALPKYLPSNVTIV